MRTPITLLVLAASLAAQAPPAPTAPTFADPVRLKAGDKFLGGGRLYPSPVLHDMNGDGIADVVVGDLPGKLTVALRANGKDMTFAAETKLNALDGAELKFHNW